MSPSLSLEIRIAAKKILQRYRSKCKTGNKRENDSVQKIAAQVDLIEYFEEAVRLQLKKKLQVKLYYKLLRKIILKPCLQYQHH